MIAILEWTQSNEQQNIEQLQTPTMGVTINKKSTTTEPLPVVEVQEMFSTHGGHLTNAMYHHGKNTLIKLLHHDETKKRAHDSQIVRAKENLKLSHGGSSYR